MKSLWISLVLAFLFISSVQAADMEISITIPEAKVQRVLDGYEVDNLADLRDSIIIEIRQHIINREYKKAIGVARDGLEDITF